MTRAGIDCWCFVLEVFLFGVCVGVFCWDLVVLLNCGAVANSYHCGWRRDRTIKKVFSLSLNRKTILYAINKYLYVIQTFFVAFQHIQILLCFLFTCVVMS
jgi:hypothetical protein